MSISRIFFSKVQLAGRYGQINELDDTIERMNKPHQDIRHGNLMLLKIILTYWLDKKEKK
jgi:hypothetical protein